MKPNGFVAAVTSAVHVLGDDRFWTYEYARLQEFEGRASREAAAILTLDSHRATCGPDYTDYIIARNAVSFGPSARRAYRLAAR